MTEHFLGVDHIGIAVRDIGEARETYGAMGLDEEGVERIDERGLEMMVRAIIGGATNFDLCKLMVELLDVCPSIHPRLIERFERLDAETLVAYELGGRARLAEGLIVDVAAFFNQHDDLIRRAPPGGVNENFENVGSARSYGVEVSTIWQPTQRLRFEGSYSFYELDAGSALTKPAKKVTPRHQFQIRSEFDLTDRIGVDASVYYVSQVRSFMIDSYVRLDVGLHWRPYDWVELAVFGQNLIGPHAEYFQPARVDTQPEIERSIYGRVKLHF